MRNNMTVVTNRNIYQNKHFSLLIYAVPFKPSVSIDISVATFIKAQIDSGPIQSGNARFKPGAHSVHIKFNNALQNLMAHTHCTERGPGMGLKSKWVVKFYAELFTLHWHREQDRTPLGFIQIFPFQFPLPLPVPYSVYEP